MLGDIQSKTLLHVKGWLFRFLGALSAALILLETWDWRVAFLLAVTVWSFCRFYYYAFYVIEKYADPSFKFAGITSFLRYLLRRRN